MKARKKAEKKSNKVTKKKKLSSNITTIILILIFLVGLSVMLYPTVSNLLIRGISRRRLRPTMKRCRR